MNGRNTIQWKRCNAIQNNAYKTLQYKSMQCKTIQNNATQNYATHYNGMQCNTNLCNTIQCHAMQYKSMQHNTMPCNAIQIYATQYNAMQCNTFSITRRDAIQYDAEKKQLKTKPAYRRIQRRVDTKLHKNTTARTHAFNATGANSTQKHTKGQHKTMHKVNKAIHQTRIRRT